MITQNIEVEIELLEPMLGTVPKDKSVYENFVAKRQGELAKKLLASGEYEGKKLAELEQIAAKLIEEELSTIKEAEEKGWTGFHSDEKGIFIYNYMIRGFLKNAALVCKEATEVKNGKSKINNYVFIKERRLYPGIVEPEGTLERPLRAETMQGPRVTLAKSDFINAGAKFNFTIEIIPNKEVKASMIEELLDYGRFMGLGQWRNAGWGSFQVNKFTVLSEPSKKNKQ